MIINVKENEVVGDYIEDNKERLEDEFLEELYETGRIYGYRFNELQTNCCLY